MRKEAFAELLSQIDPRYVAEAAATSQRRRPVWLRWSALTASVCLVLALAAAIGLHMPASQQTPEAEAADGPPQLVLDGQRYLISPHLAVSEELPAGFTEAGTITVTGGCTDCPYYTNPDRPEWVYVYQEVRTDGTVDESGTLRATEPHGAYARYVDVRLRDRDLVCCQGEYYISLWTASTRGSTPDVSEAAYEAVAARYGVRLEGDAPQGFVFAGTAEFSGDDTVPRGTLSSNVGAREVYVDPAEPDVLLLATSWYTAPDETGEDLHTGFDVYLRYSCPFAPEAED